MTGSLKRAAVAVVAGGGTEDAINYIRCCSQAVVVVAVAVAVVILAAVFAISAMVGPEEQT